MSSAAFACRRRPGRRPTGLIARLASSGQGSVVSWWCHTPESAAARPRYRPPGSPPVREPAIRPDAPGARPAAEAWLRSPAGSGPGGAAPGHPWPPLLARGCASQPGRGRRAQSALIKSSGFLRKSPGPSWNGAEEGRGSCSRLCTSGARRVGSGRGEGRWTEATGGTWQWGRSPYSRRRAPLRFGPWILLPRATAVPDARFGYAARPRGVA